MLRIAVGNRSIVGNERWFLVHALPKCEVTEFIRCAGI
jgi:hypothetical protein